MTPKDKPALEEVKVPTRIVVGERDKILPVGMTRAIYERLRCEKELVVLEGAGHMLPVEYLERTVPLVAEWLKKYLKGSGSVSGVVAEGEGKAAGAGGKAGRSAKRRAARGQTKGG